MNKIKYFFGNQKDFLIKAVSPFGNLEIDFLDDLSKKLMSMKEAKKFVDIISFAFWCRKNNLENLKNKLSNSELRIGLGCIFHVTPSNVPLNFAYSFAFGFLTGNSNLVKLPSRDFEQIPIFCSAFNSVMKRKKYEKIYKKNIFFKYDSNNQELTQELSLKSDGRVVWGGDKTVEMLKTLKTKPRARDIFFSDRYSFCIIKSKNINQLNPKLLQNIVHKFYNDTYFMDQNACSSPHLIIWYGSKNDTKLAKNKFWKELFKIVKKKYLLDSANTIEKYTSACEDIIKHNFIKSFKNYSNLIYRIRINKLNNNVHQLNNKFGYFYEFDCNNLNMIKHSITQKFQTLTYLGLSKKELIDFIIKNNLKGIDRVVPIGSSHNIGFVWDGYNLDKQLTRVIEVY